MADAPKGSGVTCLNMSFRDIILTTKKVMSQADLHATHFIDTFEHFIYSRMCFDEVAHVFIALGL